MSFEPREFLRHILAEADYLAIASAGLTRQQFDQDPTLQRAFVRSLEIVGEAAKKVPQGHPFAESGSGVACDDRDA